MPSPSITSNADFSRFERALRPVCRWDITGNVISVPPAASFGAYPRLLRLLTAQPEFGEALYPLVKRGLISQESGEKTYIYIHPDAQMTVKRRMSTEELLMARKQAICVVSHACPEEASIDQDFDDLRSILAAQVFHCAEDARRHYEIAELVDVLPKLILMLLTSLGRSGNEPMLLQYTESLIKFENDEIKSDGYYRCLAARWRAYM